MKERLRTHRKDQRTISRGRQWKRKGFVFLCLLFVLLIPAAGGCAPASSPGAVPDASGAGSGISYLLPEMSEEKSADAGRPDASLSGAEHPDAERPSPVYGLDPEEILIPERYRSDGIENTVKRARELSRLVWTPASDVLSFDGLTVFRAGEKVLGVPYGQPVYRGGFVCYDISVSDFLQETKRAGGQLYTETGWYQNVCPYYSTDCSTFVSYTWNLPKRMVCASLVRYGDIVGNTVDAIEVGDALIRASYDPHAVLVTGAVEDENGKLLWAEITEQTVPLTRVTRYGEGEILSLSDLKRMYFEDGFAVYRNTDYRDGIPE